MLFNSENKGSLNSPHSNLSPIEGAEQKPSIKYSYNKNKAKKPKRNKSAFILFSIDARAKLKLEEGENVNSNEMMVKLADLWKNLPQEERERYDKGARDDKRRYLEELDVFSKENPFEVIQNKTTKNHIKKPCSAYALFLKEAKVDIKKENCNLKMADVLKIVSERWKNIDKDDKTKYEEKAQIEKDAIREKLKENLPKNNTDTEASLKRKKVKQLEKIRKEMKMSTAPISLDKLNTFSPLNLNHERPPLSNKQLKPDIFSLGILQSTSNLFSTKPNIISPIPTYPGQESKIALLPEIPSLNNSLLQAQRSLLTITSNLFPKKTSKEDNDANELLKLFDKSFKSSSELLIDLLNFDVNPAKRDSSNLLNPSSLKLNSNPFASINDIANFPLRGNGPTKPSRQEALNNVLMSVLNPISQSESKVQDDKENKEYLDLATLK